MRSGTVLHSIGDFRSADWRSVRRGSPIAPVKGVLSRIDPAIILPAVVLAIVLVFAVAPGLIAPFSPTEMDDLAILDAPGARHWMGTDHIGRDILSLVVYGARHSVLISVCTVALALAIGGVAGLLAGYIGGLADAVLMRIVDLWLAIPNLVLVIIVATALGPSFFHTVLAISIAMVPRKARVIRSQVLAIRNLGFVDASRSIGASSAFILLRHVLPHTLGTILVLVTLSIADAMLMGASLSFIGLGVIDDMPDWGFLLSQGRNYVSVAWWFAAFPGLAITSLVISINLLGEALRNRVDPLLRVR